MSGNSTGATTAAVSLLIKHTLAANVLAAKTSPLLGDSRYVKRTTIPDKMRCSRRDVR